MGMSVEGFWAQEKAKWGAAITIKVAGADRENSVETMVAEEEEDRPDSPAEQVEEEDSDQPIEAETEQEGDEVGVLGDYELDKEFEIEWAKQVAERSPERS